MYILVSGATTTVMEQLKLHPNLGVLLCPDAGNVAPPVGVTWAADNSAYSGFDDARYRPFLKKIGTRQDCLWITAPDVVGDAAATLTLWKEWAPRIREAGARPALVAQDGLVVKDVPWDELGAIFIGGTTRYKLSEAAAQIVGEGNRRNLWTHMGRVNSKKRLLYAAAIGCRSIDGSGFSQYAAIYLPWGLKLARGEDPPYPRIRKKKEA